LTAKQWIKTPKSYVTITMIIFLLLASLEAHSVAGIVNGIVAIFVSVVLDVLFCRFEKRKRIMPDGAVITGLIIALILGTTTSLAIVAATAFLAILFKHILIYKNKAIFNPAAFGLFLSILLFHTEQSWWGAFGDLSAWTIIVLLIGGYMVTNRVNKFQQVFMFLGTSFVLLLIMGLLHVGDAADAFRPPFINATLFFGFFMLTDPPTSPAKTKDQIAYSFLVALVGTVIYGIFGGLMYLFIGLFIGNLYHVFKKRAYLKEMKARPKVTRSTRSSRMSS
jgi:Na+-translocating ferredoxin:NAD+ oxidoreductase RnfD subunit